MTGAEIVLKWCKDFAEQNGGQDPSPYEIRCQLEMAVDFERDYKPEDTPQGKYTPEQIAFLEKCAISAPVPPNWFHVEYAPEPKSEEFGLPETWCDWDEPDSTNKSLNENLARYHTAMQQYETGKETATYIQWRWFFAETMLQERTKRLEK